MPLSPRLRAATSAAERIACLMLKGCDADSDLRTLHDWARAVNMSRSMLTQACEIVRVQPHDARDFTRIMRVLCRHDGRAEHLRFELLVNDHKTLANLLARGGVSAVESRRVSPAAFVEAQTFIDAGHPVLATVLRLLGRL